MKRIGYMFITLFIVISVVLFLVRLLPGTPFNEEKLNAEQIAQLQAQYGLDDPVPVQYVRYLTGVFQGKLGISFKQAGQTVEGIIKLRIGPSAMLGAQALVLGSVVGLILGIVAALNRNSIWDYLCTILCVLGVSALCRGMMPEPSTHPICGSPLEALRNARPQPWRTAP